MGVGKPLKFKTPQQLENKINNYFKSITITYPLFDSVVIGEDAKGNPIYEKVPRLNNAGKQIMFTEYVEHPSVLGLAAYLKTTRKTLLEYEEKEEYSNTVKKAKERIEQYLEEQLYRKEQVTGIIFNLKNNFGWKDKTEVESNNKNDNTIHIKLDSELQEWAK